ncbi:MAG: methyltransferase domain-containing protein [Eubacterium sp.]|nr:methyltransferase domain-containing protein [Eubacterium sp.]
MDESIRKSEEDLIANLLKDNDALSIHSYNDASERHAVDVLSGDSKPVTRVPEEVPEMKGLVAKPTEQLLTNKLSVLKQIEKVTLKIFGELDKMGEAIIGTAPTDVPGEYCLRVVADMEPATYLAGKLHFDSRNVPIVDYVDNSSRIIYKVSRNENVLVEFEDENSVRSLGTKLLDFGFRDVLVVLGSSLGTRSERIETVHPYELVKYEKQGGPWAALVKNSKPIEARVTGFVSDKLFDVESAPLYSPESRSVILGKLRLSEDSVVYDIGAGVGVFSVECALTCPKGHVYAIERDPDNLQILRGNRRRFYAENMEVVLGIAPSVFEKFDAPTHAIIGITPA